MIDQRQKALGRLKIASACDKTQVTPEMASYYIPS
jgi:hypothetical protein